MAQPLLTHRDGRTARAERTRRAFVQALLSLLEDGELRPTAERIAARASVSERSVFQHFPDREALVEAVARQQFEQVMREVRPVDASRSLTERIDEYCDQRARIAERISPVRRAGALIEHESHVVAGWLRSARRAASGEVERVFRRELEQREKGEREVLLAALIGATSWEAWEGLRVHQELGPERARATMRATVSALLGER